MIFFFFRGAWDSVLLSPPKPWANFKLHTKCDMAVHWQSWLRAGLGKEKENPLPSSFFVSTIFTLSSHPDSCSHLLTMLAVCCFLKTLLTTARIHTDLGLLYPFLKDLPMPRSPA